MKKMKIVQPKVPLYRGGNVAEYAKQTETFLKDFCMSVWKSNVEMKEEISRLKERIEELEGIIVNGA